MSVAEEPWGEWMGGWKKGVAASDQEADRIDRQKAAFGAETLAKLKDLNVLIVGLRGVGIEAAKNLILTNVGSVTLWDPEPTQVRDLGSNFYLREAHAAAGIPRPQACLKELESLNPYCKVKVHDGQLTDEFLKQTDVAGTGKPFAAVVVTRLLPKEELFRINECARAQHTAFLMAVTSGVSASLFADFGPAHTITDHDGEPVETYALSNIEVISKPPILKVSGVEDGAPIVVLSFASDVAGHDGLDDGDTLELDDFSGDLACLQGGHYKVKRVMFVTPEAAKVDVDSPEFKLQLGNGMAACVEGWTKQHDTYKAEWEAAGSEGSWSSKIKSKTLFSRMVLVPDAEATVEACKKYTAGGLASLVKPLVQKKYLSLAESLEACPAPQEGMPGGIPQMVEAEAWQAGQGIDVHLALNATLDFQESCGHWPRLHSAEDASKVLELAAAASTRFKASGKDGAVWAQAISWGFPSGEDRELDETRIKRWSKLYGAELTGFCAFLGGAIAQEVIKKTGKFTPIEQWIHHEDHALVTDECASNLGPLLGTRYDDQIAILGKDFQARVAEQRIFMVGCGALGCEYLKGLSLMGACTSHRGKLLVTDMDTIETSNLSRQFLFRDSDVTHSKSKTGARVVKEWNPPMNVEGVEQFVGASTEHIFDDEFWEGLDLCWNALDNVAARKYTDGRCLWYSKPLLESGTTGTKSNSEVVLPFRTQSYNDGEDPPETGIAMCTLRSFPYLPLHCIEFAKQKMFTEHFEFAPTQFEAFRTDMGAFFEQLGAMSTDNERLSAMQSVMKIVQLQTSTEGGVDFPKCVKAAFERLMADFRDDILNVIADGDGMEASGKAFWTGTKRRPNPVDWAPDLPEAELSAASSAMRLPLEYLYCAANLFAQVHGLEPMRDRSQFESLVRGMALTQPKWCKSARLAEPEEPGSDEGAEAAVDDELLGRLEGELYAVDVSQLSAVQPHDFEKDDDDNFHIDFLTAATNMRAWNYNIKQTPRHAVKVTAGRIIPALATTTAMVCGLVDIEFCKLVLGLQNSKGAAAFLNSNINLATGSNAFNVFNPLPPVQLKTAAGALGSYSSWDKIEVGGVESVADLVALLEERYGVVVEVLYDPAVDIKTAPNGIYARASKAKLGWEIKLTEDGKLSCTEECFKAWPQLRQAGTMLGRLPPESGARKRFEQQVSTAVAALEKTKASFQQVVNGPIEAAYEAAYRPLVQEDEKKLAQFDKMRKARDYVTLQGAYTMAGVAEDDEVQPKLPPIKVRRCA